MPSGMELFVVLAVIVLLFGGKKIPELAKGMGKGIKEFKTAMNEEDEEPKKEIASTETKKVEEKTEEKKSQEA